MRSLDKLIATLRADVRVDPHALTYFTEEERYFIADCLERLPREDEPIRIESTPDLPPWCAEP